MFWLGVLAQKVIFLWLKAILFLIGTYMVQLKCIGGRRFGIILLGPNVIFSYGCWLRRNVSLGRIFIKEAFKELMFASYARTMKSVSLTCFFFALSRRKYGIDGGRLGVMVLFMLPL